MFAFIKNNKISVLSPILIDGDFEKIIEFDPSKIQNPYFDGSQIIEAPKIETEAEKFERIFEKLKKAPKLEKSDLEGLIFDDRQIGDLILHRVFDGNPHGEMALQSKFTAFALSMILGKTNNELFAEIQEKQMKINEIREFFGLKPLGFN